MRAGTARLCIAVGILLLCLSAQAQVYTNIVNRPFETVSNGPQNVIVIDIDRAARSSEAVERLIRERVARAARAQAQSARTQIRLYKQLGVLPEDYRIPLLYTVVLRRNGELIYPTRTRSGELGNGTVRLEVVDGNNPFPPAYKELLQTLAQALPALVEAEYGKAARTLTIQIVNYDDVIGDPDAVVGGIYDVTNNRFLFPIYRSREAAAVNLLNLTVRAFHADVAPFYDVWEEGFARAVTTRIARGAAFRNLAGLNPEFIDLTLNNTYDARPYYDAWNQPTLGSPSFIAPSLRQLPIAGGTTSGLWLVRYQMAGSLWLKVATEYPSFFREFNRLYYQNYTPALQGDSVALLSLAKQVLSAISGNPNPTLEGVPFNQWVRRQYILDTSVTYGRKLHAQILPYISSPQPGEEAAFIVLLTYFQTKRAGNSWDESLLSGTCYPVYWDYNFNRLTLSPQYERVDIRGGTGAVVPSFVGTETGNQRLTIDFSVGTESVRVYYPSSKVQGVNFRNNFFGVVFGLEQGRVEVQIGGETRSARVDKGAFGVLLSDELLARERVAILRFFNTREEPVGEWRTNTGVGFHYVQAHLTPASSSFTLTLPQGLHMISLPLRPFERDMAKVLGISANQLRLAHWRQERSDYVYYPDTPPPAPGVGYFLQLREPLSVTVQGEPVSTERPFAVALQPGWNLVGMPLNTPIPVGALQVVHQFDAPVSWETASTSTSGRPALVGETVWTLGASGTYVRATQLEPGRAYWIRVLRPEGVTLLFAPPTRSSRAPAHEQPAWAMEVALQSPVGGGVVVLGLDNTARVRSHADSQALPPALPGMSVFGIREGDGELLAQAVKPVGTRQEWTLLIAPAEPNREHTLTWQLPETTPRRWRLYLENPATGERVDMRQRTFYRFTPAKAQTLRVVLEPALATPVRIVNLSTTVSRSGQATIQFQLTGEATWRAEVRSLRGEVVRILQPSQASRAGIQSIVWNGRDTHERALPPGTYLVQIEATDAEGRVARATTTIVLTR
ncbi:MAG: FlgD immunoglobulin-like domain containing protein [Armatimonadota bacterium]|nr:FlgD immunoglobulin-like domain containing protein [Armatimonadota bacterium]